MAPRRLEGRRSGELDRLSVEPESKQMIDAFATDVAMCGCGEGRRPPLAVVMAAHDGLPKSAEIHQKAACMMAMAQSSS